MFAKAPILTWSLRLAAVIVLASFAAGCGGGSKGTISGRVLYQGKPFALGGIVTFVPEHGGAFNATIDREGNYSVAGIPPGAVKIAVSPDPVAGRGNNGIEVPSDMKPEGVDLSQTSLGSRPNQGGRLAPPPLPAKYANPDESGLTYTVESGRQSHDIDLK